MSKFVRALLLGTLCVAILAPTATAKSSAPIKYKPLISLASLQVNVFRSGIAYNDEQAAKQSDPEFKATYERQAAKDRGMLPESRHVLTLLRHYRRTRPHSFPYRKVVSDLRKRTDQAKASRQARQDEVNNDPSQPAGSYKNDSVWLKYDAAAQMARSWANRFVRLGKKRGVTFPAANKSSMKSHVVAVWQDQDSNSCCQKDELLPR